MTKDYSFLPLLIDEEIFLLEDRLITDAPTRHPKTVQVIASEIELVFKGENRKRVVIVVDQPGIDFISPGQEALLKNILTAINLNSNDIALVNLQKCLAPPTEYQLNKVGCDRLIGFGVGLNAIEGAPGRELNAVISLKNTQYLFTHSLDELNEDRLKKMSLWKNLKTMFNLI